MLLDKWHCSIRHSTATLLFSEGVHPKVVQELLGHSNISITLDVYSHVLPGMQQDAISRLNSKLAMSEDFQGLRPVHVFAHLELDG